MTRAGVEALRRTRADLDAMLEGIVLPAQRPEFGLRYELHNGEVVVVPLPRPWYVKAQTRIELKLQSIAGEGGVVLGEWPYRPLPNLQYWVAGLSFIPHAQWNSMSRDEWQVYAPLLIVEILSSSNTSDKVKRQRITSMSAGTEEFWIVDHEKKAVEVSRLDSVRVYGPGDVVPLPLFNGSLKADEIFA